MQSWYAFSSAKTTEFFFLMSSLLWLAILEPYQEYRPLFYREGTRVEMFESALWGEGGSGVTQAWVSAMIHCPLAEIIPL